MLKKLTSLLLVLALTAGLALPALAHGPASLEGEEQGCIGDTYELEIEIHIFITDMWKQAKTCLFSTQTLKRAKFSMCL
jgi:hypothetical protein